jgi:hypothetical protein
MESTNQVLVVTSNRNMKRIVMRSLVSAGFNVVVCRPHPEEIEQGLRAHPDMCIVDAGEQREEIQWLIDLLYSKHKDVIALLASEDHDSNLVRESLTTKNLNNLIAKHGGVSAMSERIDESELVVTCQKLLKHDIFGLEKYLTTWGIQINELEITGTDSKPLILNELEDFLDRLDCYKPVKHSVLLVADELVMNAIFNAPLDADGRPRYATLDRSKDLELEPHEHAVLHYACDGRHIALAVKDPFGSLDREVLVRYLQNYFEGGPAAVEEKEAGAGLGLYMVINSITQLTFNIHSGIATEVIAMFYVHGGSLAFQSSGRSLNLFYIS